MPQPSAHTRLPADDSRRSTSAAWWTPRELEASITDHTVLVTIMHANNETGTVQRIRKLAQIAHTRGVPMHTDAAQSVGKIQVDVDELDVDLLTVVGHKVYAP